MTPQSVSGAPVAPLVTKKILGQANGKISFGLVTSKTTRCVPLSLLSHTSAVDLYQGYFQVLLVPPGVRPL